MHRAALFEHMSIDDKSIQEALQSHRSTVAGVLDNCQVIKERAQQQLNAVSTLMYHIAGNELISPRPIVSLVRQSQNILSGQPTSQRSS